MPNWNPNYPEVLGNEFLVTNGQQTRVWSGAPARSQRLISTVAEDIESLRLTASVNPLLRSSLPTLIDVAVEGNDYVPTLKTGLLAPTSDVIREDWTTAAGGTTGLFNEINEDTLRWPGPAQFSSIKVTSPQKAYACSVDASRFASGGAAENGRIAWVAVNAIMGANTGFRKMGLALRINGSLYPPAGGGIRDVHGFGAMYSFWWGEINPATGMPWLPADIADFNAGGSSTIFVRSQNAATASHYPTVHALALDVRYADVENREAVGVWRRPEDIGTERLLNIETDALLSLPSGTPGWSKLASTNHVYYWRMSVSPSEYGATIADDVRWMGVYQHLGPRGIPAGSVYPLHSDGERPPPDDVLTSDTMNHDAFGRQTRPWGGGSRAAYGLAPIRSLDGLPSIDSQPYRMDLSDVAIINSTRSYGQRVTMPSAQNYIGVRLPIIPPASGPSILSVGVYRVSDGVQMGGTYQISDTAARRQPAGEQGIRYITGRLSSSADLAAGVAYEIRVSVSGTGDWYGMAPNTSVAPNASFGGASGDGAFVGAVHDPERELSVNLIREPDPVTGFTATVGAHSVSMPDGTTRDVDHVDLSWVAPASPLGSSFSRYELERSIEADEWGRIANLNDASLLEFRDHMVPRNLTAEYRVRQVAKDGRVSDWAYSAPVVPVDGDYDIVLTSNHTPELEVVMDAAPEAAYQFLSTEGEETVSLHGVDYQVVFTEVEDRGISWQAEVELNFGDEPPIVQSGQKLFTSLLDITRSTDTPYVVAMDHQGTRILGHVKPTNASQQQPGNVYKATITVVPTHTEEVPVEVEP